MANIIADFLSLRYLKHNHARLMHLNSLGLDLNNKKVLEVGAGIGDHTSFYLFKGCSVLPTDARPELVEFIKQRLGINSVVVDVEKTPQELQKLGHFDILHCYGLLYHLANPEKLLKIVPTVAETLLLETSVNFTLATLKEKSIIAKKENKADLSQAASGMGCLPSREWLWEILSKEYKFVYCPKTQPNHAEFPKDWTKPCAARLKRAIFIASHNKITSDSLTTSLPEIYR